MERDFLCFSSRNGTWNPMKVDEANKPKDPVMGSGMQWSFSNKVSALPHFLSFKTTQEERSRSTISDPLASSGYMTISTKDAFESNQKPLLGLTQRNLSIGKQAGSNHGMTVYPLQCSDAQSASLQEPRNFPVSNQSKQLSPVLQSSLATTGLNMVNSAIKPQQPLGSKTSATPVSILSSIGSIVGSTDLRNCSKSSGNPAQLTIFYGGSVCVYDDISPEKAKAVMLMAGNGSAAKQNVPVSKAKLQTEISVPSKNGGFNISKSFPSPSPPPLPSPIPVTSHAASSHPRGGSSGNNELPMMRSARPSTSPNNHLESPIVVASARSASTKMIQPGGLPQARKASLARFLEKRKERVISTLPYYNCNRTSPECSTPGSDSVGFSMDFSGSCSLPTSN